MTFLFDHDTPDDVAYSLQTLGHQVVRLREVLPVDSSDTAILAHARAQARKTRVAERAALVRLLDAAGEGGIRNNINFA
jgi:Domain of unknown function (DUF5615)